MNRLEKRVEKLEGSGPSDEVLIWANVPDSWDTKRQEAAAEALAREWGYEPPFRFDLRPLNNVREVEPIFIGTNADFKAFWDALIDHVLHGEVRRPEIANVVGREALGEFGDPQFLKAAGGIDQYIALWL